MTVDGRQRLSRIRAASHTNPQLSHETRAWKMPCVANRSIGAASVIVVALRNQLAQA